MKTWFESWTIWVNVIGVAIIALQIINQTNLVADPQWQALILAILNILLRFKTKAPIAR